MHRRRPDPPQGRRRAARRPDPDERPRRRPGLLPLARHPRRATRCPSTSADVIDRGQGRRLRPGDRRDARHRPGRRGDRAVRRPLALRHDAGVRRRLASWRRSTCSTSPTPSRSTSSSAAAPRTRCATSAASWSATASAFGKRPGRHAGLRHQRRHLQRRRRHRALPAPARPARRSRPRGRARARCPRVDVRHSSGIAPGRARRPGALPRRDHRDRPRLPRTTPSELAEAAAPAAAPRAGRATSSARRADAPRRRPALLEQPRARRVPPRGRRPARRLARGRRVLLRRRAGRDGPRQGDPHRADPRVAVAATRSAASRCPRFADHGELVRVLAPREPPRATSPSPPACSRSSATARTRPGCSPARATRSAPTAASRCSPRARRRDPALDRVRLGHPLRPRPRPAPRRLRQGRHLAASRSRRSTT